MDSKIFLKATDLYNQLGSIRKAIETLKASKLAKPQAVTIQFKPGTILEISDKALSDRILLILDEYLEQERTSLETEFKSL